MHIEGKTVKNDVKYLGIRIFGDRNRTIVSVRNNLQRYLGYFKARVRDLNLQCKEYLI